MILCDINRLRLCTEQNNRNQQIFIFLTFFSASVAFNKRFDSNNEIYLNGIKIYFLKTSWKFNQIETSKPPV